VTVTFEQAVLPTAVSVNDTVPTNPAAGTKVGVIVVAFNSVPALDGVDTHARVAKLLAEASVNTYGTPWHVEASEPAFANGDGIRVRMRSSVTLLHGAIPVTCMVNTTIPIFRSPAPGVYTGFTAPGLSNVPVPFVVQSTDAEF
jgi:hypothetical protein